MMCANGNEDRTRCKNHLICLPCNIDEPDDDDNGEKEQYRPNDDLPIFSPDYYDIYTSITALGFKFEKYPFPGF